MSALIAPAATENFAVDISPDALILKGETLRLAEDVAAVVNADDAERAGAVLKTIKQFLDYVEESRKETKKPYDEAGKLIQIKVKEFIVEIEKHDRRLRGLVATYLSLRQAKQLEEVKQHGTVVSSANAGKGVNAKTDWKFEVEDAVTAYKAHPELFDLVARGGLIIQAAKEGKDLPGIRVWQEVAVSVRG